MAFDFQIVPQTTMVASEETTTAEVRSDGARQMVLEVRFNRSLDTKDMIG
jgi:hypothetical protein